MGAVESKAGANAPASPAYEVHGLKFDVDTDYMQSWESLELQLQLSDPKITNIGKVRIYMQLLERITGLTTDDIAEAAGGVMAPAADVVKIAADVLKAATPKN